MVTDATTTDLRRRLIQVRLVEYIRAVAPWFLIEEVDLVICDFLERWTRREFDRGIVSLPPRGSKSTICSTFLPSWLIGNQPHSKTLHGSHGSKLVMGFSRAARRLVRSPEFQEIFPGVMISRETSAAEAWDIIPPDPLVRQLGEYRCAGVGTGIAGKGFNHGLLDDTLNEQMAYSKVIKDGQWQWYQDGFYTRRQPEDNGILIIGTRWAKDDIPGRLLERGKNDPEADQFEVLNVPAILDEKTAIYINNIAFKDGGLGKQTRELKAGDSFKPRRFPLIELYRSKANLTSRGWAAQYLGQPVEEEGHILKKKHWRRWPHAKPPKCEFILQCYDTAFEEKEEADESARTTWGIFPHSDTGDPTDRRYCAILLERWHEKIEAAKLLGIALKGYEQFEPDLILVEKRASGIQLVQELRRKKVPVSPWLPPGPKGAKSKVPRAHVASIPLELGSIWYMPRNWADDVIDQCADFPYGVHDDLADTCTMAWIYLRRFFRLEVPHDLEPDEDEEPVRGKTAAKGRRYYG